MGPDLWPATRRGVVVTAAACAAVFCLACWLRPTLYALGSIAAAALVIAGARMFLTERRAPSGPSPRHALAFNAISRVLNDHQEFVRLSVRDQAARAVLAGLDTDGLPAAAPVDCAGCASCGGPDCAEHPADDELTAQEARDLADDLGLQLYRAEDALAFVGEMCDIADEHRGRRGQPATVTTARVREWLKGAQCARQAGLVLHAEPRTTPICGDRCTTHPETVCTELPRHRMPHGGPLIIDGRECGGAAWGPDDGYAPDPDASGGDPETARTHPDTPARQDADQCGDDPDAIRNRTGTAVPTAPPLTGSMIATDTPVCGSNLPSTDGIPCGEPAVWHIRWEPGDDQRFPAGLACATHMDALAERHAWLERHRAGPACGTRTADWTPGGCTPAEA